MSRMAGKKTNIRLYCLLQMILISFLLLTGCGSTQASVSEHPSSETMTNSEQTITEIETEPSVSTEAESTAEIENETASDALPLSDMMVQLSCGDAVATFQLYDTTAAKQFYEQLPLSLETENFRNAQWMFYPPEKLDVTAEEAYHDGKKGELSYYEPWGDVFVLYEDFYAGDEMHRLGVCLKGIDVLEQMDGTVTVEQVSDTEETALQIQVEANGSTIMFELNDSSAAKSLYDQLPLTIEVQNYSSDEKIFYPPEALDTSDTPLANAVTGTLAYFEPWGDVVMYYDDFGSYSGLYELGTVVSGEEYISILSGTVTIAPIEDE